MPTDRPLHPRPERTPGALRAACTAVAPHLLAAYDQAKDQALADAVQHGSLQPVRAYLDHWAALIDIERHPETARAYHRAEHLARAATSPEEAREHLATAGAIYRAAAPASRSGQLSRGDPRQPRRRTQRRPSARGRGLRRKGSWSRGRLCGG